MIEADFFDKVISIIISSYISKEMKYHEDPASTPSLGKFSTTADLWDSNTVKLRRAIDCRCNFVKNSFNTSGCFGLTGPFDISGLKFFKI